MPPRKSPEAAVEPPPSPAESAVSLEFLQAFLRRIPGGSTGGATMYRVVDELVQPSTSATMTSYASQLFLVPRSHVSTPTWVVIHPWDMPVTELVAALEDFAADLPPTRTYFWLAALAVSQHLLPPEAALQPMDSGPAPASAAGSRATTPPSAGGGTRSGLASPLASKPGTADRGGSGRGRGGLVPGGSGGGAAAGAGGAEGEEAVSVFASAIPREALLTPPGTAGGAESADEPPLDQAMSFAAQMKRRQKTLAVKQKALVAGVRRAAVAGIRDAVRASRCGALLVVGRDVRPLRRAWCLVELAEALRSRGPEAVTLLPMDRDFCRADLVRQLRDLDVPEVVAAADEHDKEVLAEVLGVPPTPNPGDAPAGGNGAGAGARGARESTPSSPSPLAGGAAAATGNVGRRVSLASQLPLGKRSLRYSTSSALVSPGGPAGAGGGAGGAGGGAGGGGGGTAAEADPEQDEAHSGARALVRQLQLALLLRPMDGALPARMMGSPLADANPVASNRTPAPPAATPVALTGITPVSGPGAAAPPASRAAPTTPTPCAYDWLWDWSPLSAWLALTPTHPNWRALLLTGSHGAGKTTAMAALLGAPPLARLAPPQSQLPTQPQPQPQPQQPSKGPAPAGPEPLLTACHFCSAADARSLAAGEVVRSLAYQLACRSPGFGWALCGALLELGGPGGGLALCPDVWLHGVDEVVAALLRRPMELDAEARLANGERPANYLLVIDGLDEGPAAAATAAAAVADSVDAGEAATHRSVVPLAPPRTYEVLRLVIDHLQHLPGVRLILSCTTSSSSAAAAAGSGGGGNGGSGGRGGVAAGAPTASAAGGRAAKVPFVQPPPLVVAPRGAADASASVYLAVRQAVRPAEVPLAALRRDKYLPLALAHMLQEYVLSPELTARELLWQARDCLAHVHILQLLVQHAAEHLAPPGGLALVQGAAAATTAATAAAVAGGAAAAPAGAAAPGTAAVGPPPQAAPRQPPGQDAHAHPPHLPQGQGLQPHGSLDTPPRPQTPPRQEQHGHLRQPGSRAGQRQQQPQQQPSPRQGDSQASGSAPPRQDGSGNGAGPSTPVSNPEGTATSSAADGPSEPPAEWLAVGAPNTGAGGVAVHSIPPACRGSLADEYGVLWGVRTAELRHEAAVALATAAADASAAGDGGGAGRPLAVPTKLQQQQQQRQQTISMVPVLPPAPPYAPQRAARLQLLVDLLAAAQEPLEWCLLARAVLSVEAPTPTPAARSNNPHPHHARAEGPSAGGASPAGVPGSPVGASMRRAGGSGLSAAGAASASGAGGSQTGLAAAVALSRSASPQLPSPGPGGSRGASREGGRRGAEEESVDGSEWSEDTGALLGSPGRGAVLGPDLGGAQGAAALRDLEWALLSGPLAGLVWISGCGRVTIRHASFLEWLRRAAATTPATTIPPLPPASPSAPSASSPVPGTPLGAPSGPSGPLRHPLGPPRAQHGHAFLARMLRHQLGLAPASFPQPSPYQVAAAGALGRSPSGLSGYSPGLTHPRWSVEGIAAALARGLAVSGGLSAQQRQQLPLAVAAAIVGSAAAAGERLAGGPPYVSPYCLRHLVVHCAEGRLPAADVEAILLDLDYWRLVLEGGHVEMMASSLEHLLRTRGPHALRPVPSAPPPPAASGAQTLSGASRPATSHARPPSAGISPRTPPAGPTATLARGQSTATAAAAATSSSLPRGPSVSATHPAHAHAHTQSQQHAVPPTPTGLVTPIHPAVSSAATGPVSLLCGGGGNSANGAVPATAAAAAAGGGGGGLRPQRELRPLPAATASLIRDSLLWLLQAGRSLSRRPEPLAITCSVSVTPMQSPFRRLAERLTTAAVATAEGLPTPTPSSGRPTSAAAAAAAAAGAPAGRPATPGTTAAAAAAAAAAGPAPSLDSVFFPPAPVSALPHPRFRSPALRAAECPHRVTGLLGSWDGEVVLASAAWTPQASLIDAHSGRRSAILEGGPDAHAAALSTPAFAPSRRFLATAGIGPGAVTLWDPATGAPRLHLNLFDDQELAGFAAAAANAANAGDAVTATIATAADGIASAADGATSADTVADGNAGVDTAAVGDAADTGATAIDTTTATAADTTAITDARPANDMGAAPPPDPDSGGGAGCASPDPSCEPWVTCIRVYEPSPNVSASSYGVAAGTSFASTSYDSAGGGIARGSVLLAAGGSADGRVVVWAVAPDGWSAVRTGELTPPAGAADSRGGVAWLEFLPGGRSLLVVQSCSNLIRVWNVQSRNITATLRLPAACGEIFAVHIAPPAAGGGGGSGSGGAASAPSGTGAAAASTDGGGGGGGGTLIAAVCTTATELWSVERRQRVASLAIGAGVEDGRTWAESCFAFSPAGGLLATAGMLPAAGAAGPGAGAAAAAAVDPCGATLWDARSGAQVAQLRSPLRGPVRALAFTPDGGLLATAADAAVALWSAAASTCLAVLPLGPDVTEVPAVAFGRGGSVLLAAGGAAVYSWDVQLAVAASVAAGALDPSSGGPGGRGFFGPGTAASAVGGSRRGGGLPGLDPGGHNGKVEAVCFSPNGALAVSGGEDNTIRLWDVSKPAEMLFVELPGAALSVAWSPDSSLLAVALSNGAAAVWHTDGVTTAAAASTAAAQLDFARREAARLECSDGSSTVNCLGFSSDGKLLFTADGEGCAVVWSVSNWTKEHTFVPTVKAARGAAAVIDTSQDADVGDGSAAAMGVVGRYAGVALSTDGRWLLMGFGREVIVWNVKAKRESAERLGPHGAPVVAVAASPCGRRAAVGAGVTVTIWDQPDAARSPSPAAGASGGAHRNGGVGAKGAGGGGGGWGASVDSSRSVNAGSQLPFSVKAALLPAMSEITGLAFSADGSMLAASLGDGSVRVWETGRWREVGWLTGHEEGAACVAFSPDSRLLMSGGGDGRCLLWSARDVLVPRASWKE